MKGMTEKNDGVSSRKIVLVAGMHRSGTSAFARFLNLLGPALPGQPIPSVKNNNEFGFWESRPVIAINDRILADRGVAWDGSEIEIRHEVTDQRLVRSEYLAVIRRFLINAGAGKKDIVIKDPRLCRTLGFWMAAINDIGSDVAVLIPYRHPLEVAASLERRDGFDTSRSLDIWFEHNLEVERASRGYPRSFASFDFLLSDWQGCAEKAAKELQLALEVESEGARAGIDQFLIAAGRHHSMAKDGNASDTLPASISALLEALHELENDPESGAASTVVDDLWRSSSRLEAKTAQKNQRAEPAILRHQLVSSHVYLDLLRDAQDVPDDDVVQSTGERLETPEMTGEAPIESTTGQEELEAVEAAEAAEPAQELPDEENIQLRADLAYARSQIRDFSKLLQSLKNPKIYCKLGWSGENTKDGSRDQDSSQHSSIGSVRQIATKAAGHLASLVLLISYAVRSRIYQFPRRLVWATRIRRSGIFDHELYRRGLSRPHRFANAFTLALHYCVYGDSGERTPNAYFDAAFYLRYHREAVGKVPAFAHYVSIGQGLDLSPNPIIDASRYIQSCSRASGKILADFVKHSEHRHSALSPLFDSSWYRITYADVDTVGIEPLRHFLQFGWKEGRNPHPLFDIDFYRNTYPDIKQAGINPLVHYLTDGYLERRNPHVLFDSEFYSIQAGLPPDCDPLTDYLESGWRKDHDPHPLFSSEWYISNYPAIESLDLPPLLHFVEADGTLEFDPGPWFSSQKYHERYPESMSEEPNALIHYLRTGYAVGNLPADWFDAEAYIERYPDVARSYSLAQAFGHFIRTGQAEDRDAAPSNASVDLSEAAKSIGPRLPATWEEGSGTSEFVAEKGDIEPSETYTEAVAWYLPQFHPIPENDEWWGEGFTEWRNVARACSRFSGHYQPRRPGGLGYYDLRVAEVLERQVDLAKKYGISAFCFHYYWFGGKKLLDLPLKKFVENQSLDLKFCVSWANENWTRTWDGLEEDVLIKQDYSADDDEAFIAELIPILKNERYLRISGKPLLVVYRPDLLPDPRKTAERWRKHCRENGIGEIVLGCVQFKYDNPLAFGFDIAIEFPPHKLGRELAPINSELGISDSDLETTVYSYSDMVDRARRQAASKYPLIRGVCPSWDNEARRPGSGTCFQGSSPELYRKWLEECCDYAHQYPVLGESYVFVNAWNEWAEAAYIEPDLRYGYAYLDATYRAVTSPPSYSHAIAVKRKILIISHDLHNHGAQQLLLNLVRTLRGRYQYEVTVLSLADGNYRAYFEECCDFLLIGGEHFEADELGKLLSQLRASGYESALLNTVASGSLVGYLKEQGFVVTSLVHEMPRLIKEFGIENDAFEIARLSDTIVFASNEVAEGFATIAGGVNGTQQIRPQGLFRTCDRAWSRPDAQHLLEQEYGIPIDSKCVLAIGYADLRKGFDIFCRVAQTLGRQNDDVYFVWVGVEDAQLKEWFGKDFQKAGIEDRVILLPRVDEIDPFYAAADVFALTSREDPFPSVVVEAISFGLPVVAFRNAIGCEELILKSGGRLVGYMAESEFTKQVLMLLTSQCDQGLERKARAEIIREEYDWDDYIRFLLATVYEPELEVSVIVPNFNYERYLERRFGSIMGQTHPLYQIIALDDASTDNSLEKLHSLQEVSNIPFRIIANRRNSGSVISQWQTGVSKSEGRIVWIAEADDFCDETFLDHVLHPFRSDPDVVLSFTQSKQIDERGAVLANDYLEYVSDISWRKWDRAYRKDGIQEVETALAVKNTIPNVSGCVFDRRALLVALESSYERLKQLRIGADYLLYVGLLKNGAVAFCPTSLNYHTRNSAGVTLSTKNADFLISEIILIQDRIHAEFDIRDEVEATAMAFREKARTDVKGRRG